MRFDDGRGARRGAVALGVLVLAIPVLFALPGPGGPRVPLAPEDLIRRFQRPRSCDPDSPARPAGSLALVCQDPRELAQYSSSGDGDRAAITEAAGPGYRFEGDLGLLSAKPLPGTLPLYGCVKGRDQFVSHDPYCEGFLRLSRAPMGYTYDAAPPGAPSEALYRCLSLDGPDHFVSMTPSCDGDRLEFRLGYVISVAWLARYLQTDDEMDHAVTTGAVRPAYRFEQSLGFVVLRRVRGTAPLFSCRAQWDQFVSLDPKCEGYRALQPYPLGYVYSSPPRRQGVHAVYRCIQAGSGDHFVSVDWNCEGMGRESRLGYTRSSP